MPYTEDKVFPLREVYTFAERIGGSFGALVCAIRRWEAFPKDLLSYGYHSQARRALCFLALCHYKFWDRFVRECWPTANESSAEPIIREIERDFINNRLLARHWQDLPPEARILFEEAAL